MEKQIMWLQKKQKVWLCKKTNNVANKSKNNVTIKVANNLAIEVTRNVTVVSGNILTEVKDYQMKDIILLDQGHNMTMFIFRTSFSSGKVH